MEYAGFWRRVGAFVIDYIIIVVLVAVIATVLGLGMGLPPSLTDTQVAGSGAANSGNWVFVVALWLYYAYFESSAKQATFGKQALGIKVCGADGQRISFLRASGRHFAKYISGLILGIGYLMAAFTSKKQGLHDMIASCLVIKD